MSLINVIQGAASGSAVTTVPPEGVDFDGTNDYLSRSSDLTGNVDSKTFTFSCWVWLSGAQVSKYICYINGGKFTLIFDGASQFGISAQNSAGTTILSAYVPSSSPVPINTFCNILISIDLQNTLNRKIYFNDVVQTSAVWSTYINDSIDFTGTTHYILSNGSKLKGRLSHVFLDYTYRDPSIEANRRLFITADGKPTPTATLKALNPILYLPMKDNATAHINEGTGGNFTLNGTIATSERGANQDNCVASYFDGSADYLSRTSLSIVNSKKLTISFSFKANVLASTYIFDEYTSGGITFQYRTTSELRIYTAGTVLNWYSGSGTVPINKNVSVQLSVDTETQQAHFYINGKSVATSPLALVLNGYFNANGFVIAALRDFTSKLNGNIGELYFDTKYIDLATNNPFWDSTTNRPKPVRQVIKETGVTPLIAMPLDASNAGKNYGTGGDFTLYG